MRRPALILLGLAGLCAIALGFVAAPRGLSAAQEREFAAPGDVARGREVFFAGGCAACHATPRQDDRLKLGGGLELDSPFGRFFVPNISPDPEDGIGKWTTADLANALLAGVSPRSEHYYPAFPYTTYARMDPADVRDLMAFLRTLEPVTGKAPAHSLAFPFNIRAALGLWKVLYFDPGPLPIDPAHNAQWNRGRYLVEALGHCGECHSPRNALGGLVANKRYSGAPSLDGKGYVPNITPHANGIGAWTKGDLEELLSSGMTPNYDSVGSSMVAVVRNTSQLSDQDREAIATYLMSLPPVEGRPKPAKAAPTG